MNDKELADYIKSEFIKKFDLYMQKTNMISYQDIIEEICFENSFQVDVVSQMGTLRDWFDQVFHQFFLLPFLKLGPNEIMISSIKNIYLTYFNYKEEHSCHSINQSDFNKSLELLAYKHKQQWNYATPFCSFHIVLNDQEFRCTLVHKCIKDNTNHQIFLRSIAKAHNSKISFTSNPEIECFINNQINKKKNIVISGSTGSGKTTFLNTLLSSLPINEHIICIEDTKEIKLPTNFSTRLLAKKDKGKTMLDYCQYALRMSPDRIILGEIRSRETVPMILAMNTGHNGFLTTIHANSAIDTLSRISLLFTIYSDISQGLSYSLVMQLVCSNIDYIVFLKDKKISEVIRIIGCEETRPIYEQIYHSTHESNEEDHGSHLNRSEMLYNDILP